MHATRHAAKGAETNLDRIARRDRHTEAIAWQVKPSDKGAPGVSARETLSNPKPGESPGGAIERAITITATITAFDVARGTVTLADP